MNADLAVDPRAVFVIHGRNEKLRRAIFEFLRSIGLHPLEWDHCVELTGIASPYVGQVLDAAFSHAQAVLALFTPDDIARLRPELCGANEPNYEVDLTGQARANVLFETGLAFARAPDRTVIVEVGTVRPFSDIAGRHVVRLDNSFARRQGLALRLQRSGCSVNLTGVDWHTAGEFELQLQSEGAAPQATSLSESQGTQADTNLSRSDDGLVFTVVSPPRSNVKSDHNKYKLLEATIRTLLAPHLPLADDTTVDTFNLSVAIRRNLPPGLDPGDFDGNEVEDIVAAIRYF